MSDINIRIASTDDALLIATISRQTFYDTYAAENTAENMEKFLTLQFNEEKLIKEVGADGNYFYLAYIKNTIAGYIKIKEAVHPNSTERNPIELSRIYVCKGFIGKAVGRALMQTAIDFAKERGKDCLWLIVWKENKKALRFYQSFQFEIFAENIFILGDDHQSDWVMKKLIE